MTESSVDVEPAFYRPLDVGMRPWGVEEVVAMVPGVATCKLLRIREGNKGRLQRHHLKDEAGYVLEGTLRVRWADGEIICERTLEAGESFHFPPGCIHQEEAVTDCTVIEVSTPHGNDREGCEPLFGLAAPSDALPSTSPDEVTVFERWW